jgi:outer membrane protein assembly factor BamC
MKSKRNLMFAVAAAVILSACSGATIEGKKIDYKSAGKSKPLKVPADLSVPPTSDRYSIPEAKQGSATYSEYSSDGQVRPAEAQAAILPQRKGMHIERAGSQRWLSVEAEPEKLWPTVREFWQDEGFLIDKEVPEAGIMETDWAENRAKFDTGMVRNVVRKFIDQAYSYPERDKFRTRLERNPDSSGTDIFISHRGMYEVLISEGRSETSTKWQVRPSDPELEAEMLSRLMSKLAGGEPATQSQAQSKAQTKEKAPEETRAWIARTGTEPEALLMVDSFDRAWRRVGLALDRVGFTVEDRDRAKGLYFVRYVDPDVAEKEKSGGFWSKLFGGKKEDEKSKDQYRISVADAEKGSAVTVLDNKGERTGTPTASRILSLLQQELK